VGKGKGWHGDKAGHARAARKRGIRRAPGIKYTGKVKRRPGPKKVTKAWKRFEKTGRREFGRGWTGNVTGDMFWGTGMSKRGKRLYRVFFNSLGKKR